jgi:hypothetical protein
MSEERMLRPGFHVDWWGLPTLDEYRVAGADARAAIEDRDRRWLALSPEERARREEEAGEPPFLISEPAADRFIRPASPGLAAPAPQEPQSGR